MVLLRSVMILLPLSLSAAAPHEEPALLAVKLNDATARFTNRTKFPATLLSLPSAFGNCQLPDAPTFLSHAEIHLRGASSMQFPKRSLALELQDEKGNDKKLELCGMPLESDWVLYASYTDKTFIRDALAYDLWRALGHWAPRSCHIELIITTNGLSQACDWLQWSQLQERYCGIWHEMVRPRARGDPPGPAWVDGYQGIYVLIEKIKRGKDRLNVRKLKSSDNSEPEVTGGYVFKKDRLGPDEQGFHSQSKIRFTFVEPKEREITDAQRAWLTNYVNAFEVALFGPDFRDPEKGYAKYIDVDSFIDYHWMTELGKNMDGYRLSQFYHKDRGGKLKMGPLWDWDLSFGNAFYAEGWRTDTWRCDKMDKTLPEYSWYNRLFEDPDFLQRYIDRWSELRTNVFATSNILARVEALTVQARPALFRNFDRWPILGRPVYPNYYVGDSYGDEIKILKTWIIKRLAWIDSQDFPKPRFHLNVYPVPQVHGVQPVPQVHGPQLLPRSAGTRGSTSGLRPPNSELSTLNSQLEMSCQVGTIYYTTDGSDPRLRGGAVSPTAKEYKEPIRLDPALKLKARVCSDYGLWSAPALYP